MGTQGDDGGTTVVIFIHGHYLYQRSLSLSTVVNRYLSQQSLSVTTVYNTFLIAVGDLV